jgi:small GTP-binding protein
MLGDPAVGKTSLVRRYVWEVFNDKYLSTIGTKVATKDLQIGPDKEQINLTLVIWDIAGEKSFSDVRASYYHGAAGALMVCDLTRKETLENLHHWIFQFRKVVKTSPFVILANKSDLIEDSAPTVPEAERLARRYGTQHFLTSAKTGTNVNTAFRALAERLVLAQA